MTQKILARACGRSRVEPGEEILPKPDFVISYDFPGYTDVFFKQLKDEFGIQKMPEPERFGIFIDHMVPTATAAPDPGHRTCL